MTAEKTLKFAYLMRESIESRFAETGGKLPEEPESLNKFRNEVIPAFYPEYRNILDIIEECETEISLAAAKAAGKTNEKTRTEAAKRFIKNTKQDYLKGYHYTDDKTGNIALLDGYTLYVGTPILGIPEVPERDKFPDINKMIPDYPEETETPLNMETIRADFRIAHARYGNAAKELFKVTDLAVVCITNQETGTTQYFDAEKIIAAANLLGGTEFTIRTSSSRRFAPCEIKGKNGICYVCPFNRT